MASDPHPQASVDWASASAQDGRVALDLAGEPTAEWGRRLQAVIDRLDRPGRGWGSIKVTRKRVRVEGLAAGSEADLRHLLDSAVQQVNADFAAPKEGEADEGGGEGSAADREMTAALRSFAGPAVADEDDGDRA